MLCGVELCSVELCLIVGCRVVINYWTFVDSTIVVKRSTKLRDLELE